MLDNKSLELVVKAAMGNGYVYVETMGGLIPLSDWTPYGKRKNHHVSFVLCKGEIRESPITDTTDLPIYTGIWRLER